MLIKKGTHSSIPWQIFKCYAEKQACGKIDQEILDTQVNPAVWEISGHMVLKRREDYDNASEDYAWRLLSEVSLLEERFEEVKAYVSQAADLLLDSECSSGSQPWGMYPEASWTTNELSFSPRLSGATLKFC